MKVIITVTILAVFCIVNTNSATIQSEEFGEQIRRIVNDGYVNAVKERPPENANEEKRYCYDTPCGWLAYDKVTRRGHYLMRNTCKCLNDTYKCIRTGENVSMSAFVYHCRQNTTVDDLELPDEYMS